MIAGTSKGKVIQMPACISGLGIHQRHQFAAFRGSCVRCGRDRDPERCRCGALSIELAEKRGHRCPSPEPELPPAA